MGAHCLGGWRWTRPWVSWRMRPFPIGWLIKGFVCLFNNRYMMIDGIDMYRWYTKPAPIFLPKGHYWVVLGWNFEYELCLIIILGNSYWMAILIWGYCYWDILGDGIFILFRCTWTAIGWDGIWWYMIYSYLGMGTKQTILKGISIYSLCLEFSCGMANHTTEMRIQITSNNLICWSQLQGRTWWQLPLFF